MGVARPVHDDRAVVPGGETQAIAGEGRLDVGRLVRGPCCGPDVCDRDGGAFGLSPFPRRRRRDGTNAVQQPGGLHCCGHVVASLALQGGSHSAGVLSGDKRKSLVVLGDPIDLLPAWEVVVEPDRSPVRTDAAVDPVAVLASGLGVDRLGEWLGLQAELTFELRPITRPLCLGPRSAGRRVGVDVIERLPGAGVSYNVAQLGDLPGDVVGDQAAGRARPHHLLTGVGKVTSESTAP